MFTKKPERETAGDPLQKIIDRSGSDAVPSSFTERVPSYTRSSSSSAKMVPSIIGEDLMITGNVVSKGEIQVDGTIKGDVHCGSLLLGDKSEVIGGVTAEDIVVRGKVVGSVRGLRVTLQSQSRVEGDIYHQSLAIEQGAFFEGKSRRSDNPMADVSLEKPAAAPGASHSPASAPSPAASPSGAASSAPPAAKAESKPDAGAAAASPPAQSRAAE